MEGQLIIEYTSTTPGCKKDATAFPMTCHRCEEDYFDIEVHAVGPSQVTWNGKTYNTNGWNGEFSVTVSGSDLCSGTGPGVGSEVGRCRGRIKGERGVNVSVSVSASHVEYTLNESPSKLLGTTMSGSSTITLGEHSFVSVSIW